MFEGISAFFNIIIYQPLFNALIFLYEHLPIMDFGVAVIALTVLIRLVLYPLGTQGIKAQKALSEIQPKMKEIQEKYKNDREKQGKEMMLLYKKEKINPLAGCLPILIQLPIIIGIYQVFRVFQDGLSATELEVLYSFIPSPEIIGNPSFLGIIDLASSNIYLAFIAGILQFFQMKMMLSNQQLTGSNQVSKDKKQDQMSQFSNMMQKQMLYFFPVFTVVILWTLPSAIGLYWITFTLFAIIQQYLTFRSMNKLVKPAEAIT